MNVPKASNAVETNLKLFGPYARKLESDHLETYTTFSEKLAKWLADERAYYPAARPQILRLLKIAQLTLRRNVNADLDFKSPFHISSCVEHPMVAPYSKLLKAVHPHKELFVEPDLYAEVKALLKTITALVPPTHIDLTSEPNSPVEPFIAHTENFAMQPTSSSLASTPSFSPVHSLSTASVPHHSQPPRPPSTSQTNLDSVTRASLDASDLAVFETYSPYSMNGGLSTFPIYSGTTPSVKDPNDPPLSASSHAPSVSSPQLSNTRSETTIIPKVKKKKKKKAEFGLESLIQADIQDLKKRGVTGVCIKAEPTISNLPNKPGSLSGPLHREVIVLDDDEPAGQPSEVTPPLSPSRSMQLVGLPGIAETVFNEAVSSVNQVSPHESEHPSSHMNDDYEADMTVDKVLPQQSEHHPDNIDIDMTDGTSGTTVMKGGSLSSHRIFPLVHGWTFSQQLHQPQTDLSTKIAANDSNLKATIISERHTETEITRGGNSMVSDVIEAKDFRSSEKDIPLRDATSLNGSQSVGSDVGRIPSVTTHSMTNGVCPIEDPAPILPPPETNDAQSLSPSFTGALFAVSENDLGSSVTAINATSSQSLATMPLSPIAPSSSGGSNVLSACSRSEPVLMDTASTAINIIGECSSSQDQSSSVPPPSTTESVGLRDVPVLPPSREQLRALHAFGPDTRMLLVHKGINRKRLGFKIRFNILEEQYHAIIRWNNRKNPAEDLSICTCASLACYSRASARFEQKRIEEISDLPVTWPTGGSLSMNVMYKGQLTAFPLSPPFKAGPNGLVDVSEYICLGENVIEFNQSDDMSAHIFVLRLHRPTSAQLEQVAERRQKNKAWDDWLVKMAEPMVVPIVQNSFLK